MPRNYNPELMMIDGGGEIETTAERNARLEAEAAQAEAAAQAAAKAQAAAQKAIEDARTAAAAQAALERFRAAEAAAAAAERQAQAAAEAQEAKTRSEKAAADKAMQKAKAASEQAAAEAAAVVTPEPTTNRRRGGPDVMQVDDNVVMGTVLDSVITAILNSDAVMGTSANESPSLEQVQNIASQLLDTITPIIAPDQVVEQNYLDQVAEKIALEIVNNPAVIKAPEGEPVAPEVIQEIVQAITPEAGRSTASTPTPTPTPAIPTDVASPAAEELYNKLKGRAGAGIQPTPEEQDFLNKYLIRRGEVLKGLETAGNPLTPVQEAEKEVLTDIGVIGSDKPYTGPTGPTEPIGPTSPTGTPTGPTGTPTGPTGGNYEYINGKMYFNGKPFTGNLAGEEYKDGVSRVASKEVITPTGPTGPTTTGPTGPTRTGPTGTGATGTGATGPVVDNSGRQSAYDILYNQFASYGLGDLVAPLKGLITSDVSPSEFTIRLRDSQAYKDRFRGNQLRVQNGLAAVNEASYLALEDQYQNIMRNYGLPESYYSRGYLGRQQGLEQFIANDVSATELEDRIATAQQRVINANPEVSIALKTFYPDITNGDLLAYALDPTKGLEQIKRRITAAEIGSSAVQMGLATNVTDAEYLARYGVTKQTAKQGYGTIAGGLQRGSQLASIYGEDPYTQTTAEREVFSVPGADEARKQRQKITGLEKATFGGQTGITSGALARDRAGGF